MVLCGQYLEVNIAVACVPILLPIKKIVLLKKDIIKKSPLTPLFQRGENMQLVICKNGGKGEMSLVFLQIRLIGFINIS